MPEPARKSAAKSPGKTQGPAPLDGEPISAPIPNFEKLAQNVSRMMAEGSRVMAAYMKPLETGENPNNAANEMVDAVRSLGKVAEYWLKDPARTLEAQTAISTKFIDLWGNTLRRMTGEHVEPVVPHDARDKRFADPQWRESPVFDFIRQAYTLTVDWANDMVARDPELDSLERAKAAFYVRQAASALSPSNFVGTNPELLRTTLKEEGENLVRGLHMLAEDIEAGRGSLRLRQSDSTKFVLGENMAITPGKVVWRNDLIELIQYAPTTEKVYRRPLLIVPPWINKFYILDLNPEKSFIKWCVDQGLTVFVVSWVNPDGRHRDKGFDAYMREGIFDSLKAIETITGERQVSTIGYCVGGTLMAVTLAYMAAIGDDRIASTTFFTTQVDFTEPGELKVFTDANTIRNVEADMAQTGYLDGSRMANAFNMLRPTDLIWSYVVNNYIKGQAPMAFDLLTWNSDSTRMTAANHSFYLRECYLKNSLAKGEMAVDGVKLDVGKVTIPIYDLAAREDHIAPAKSAFNGAKLFGGPVRYVMSGSGHIAGVVNPPYKPKYQYWTGDKPEGAFEDWVNAATEHPGSWWPNWIEWMKENAPEMVPAREPGGGKLPTLGDAPGDYVKARC
ncbi:MAG: class I poly(R)-hydroxyalkanoic acid synthase [Methylobacteriaceae bacterium]|nr:class I poly(R)-hydroxyalkanoic acid synthase [Methylobacteriaceae bacterium]MCC0001722.1 class I poly(R)-hydroxyalkanoic acid synthase [Methylobacteriaceae bacterium]